MIPIESKWDNIEISPSMVTGLSYVGKNHLMLELGGADYELIDFAATKLYRMTNTHSRLLDKAFNNDETDYVEHCCNTILQKIQNRQESDPLVLRILKEDDAVKSIVGRNYIPIDMEELEAHAEQILIEGGMHEFGTERYKSNYARGHDTTRYIVSNNEKEVPNVGDVMSIGLQIKNNELGTRGISISLFMQRLECMNGMVSLKTEQTLNTAHLGNKEALLTEFDEIATKIVDSAWDVLEWIDSSNQIALTQVEMYNFIDHMVVDKKVSGKVGSKIKNAIEKENHGANKHTMWGFINAITGVSSHDVNHGVKDKLEVIASNLLDLKDIDKIQEQLVKVEIPN